MQETIKSKIGIVQFQQRLDFYWQFIAVYTFVLFLYAILKGSIDEGVFSITLKDPIVVLLSIFVGFSALNLLINYYKKKSIIIGKDFIIFKTRFKEKKYSINDISKISIGKERFSKIPKPIRIIKINIKNRRRTIRIRTFSFWNEKELIKSISNLKRYLK